MLTGPYFKPFLDILNLSRYSFALPFRWNDQGKRLIVTSSKLCYLMIVFGGLISVIYISVLIHQLLTSYATMTPALAMILMMWLSINIGVVQSKLSALFRQREITNFFNDVIKFEKNYFAGEGAIKKAADPSVFLVLQLTYVSVASFPLAVSSYIALKPCTPPFITSYILQCSDTLQFTGQLQAARFSLAVFEGLFWFHIVGLAAFQICFLLYLSQKCLRAYLYDLSNLNKKRIERGHNIQKEKDVQLAILKEANNFRQIQILHGQLRELLRKEILPVAQTVWMVLTIISLFTTIKLHNVIELPLYLFFPMCAVDGAVFFYVVTGASAQTYNESYHLINKVWRANTLKSSKSNAKWFKRFLKSCVEFRMYVGSVGFLDRTTPLAIIHFCLAQTGGLILLGN